MDVSLGARRLEVGARAVGELGVLRVAPPAHELLREAWLDDAAFGTGALLCVEGVRGVGVETNVGELRVITVLGARPDVPVHPEHDVVARRAAEYETFVLRAFAL